MIVLSLTHRIAYVKRHIENFLNIKDPNRFVEPGVLTITDEAVLLRLGENGKVVIAPDTKQWSIK